MQNILVYGTILYDHIGDDYFIGGCHTNVAAHCARLAMDTALISCVGEDALGEKAVSWLANAGICTDYIAVDREHPTGTVEVDLTDPSAPEYMLQDHVAYDYIRLDEKQIRKLKEKKVDFFYFGMVEQRHPVSTETLYRLLDELDIGCVFFDINLRKNCYTIPAVIASLKRADILKANEDEMKFLAAFVLGMPDVPEQTVVSELMRAYGIQTVVVTRGKKGASAYQETERLDVEAFPVEVNDTVGAGDGFSAAFLYKLAQTGKLEAALEAGALMGAYVSGRRSALPEYTGELLEQIQK